MLTFSESVEKTTGGIDMRWGDQRGMVTLEACVSVLSFLLLMLLLSSLFVMFMAQNMTAHALLQTAESLSLDAYTITTMKLILLPHRHSTRASITASSSLCWHLCAWSGIS